MRGSETAEKVQGRGMKAVLVTCATVAAALTIWGFLPDLHRSAVSIALLRPAVGIGCFLGLIAGRLWVRGAFGTLGIVALGSVLIHALPGNNGGDLRLYSKNLLFSNKVMEPIAEDILAADVDLVLLQELTDTNSHILDILADSFPYQHVCRYSGLIRIAVLSRLTMTEERVCSQNRSTAAARIMVRDRLIWIASVHIPHPWPTDTAETEAEVPVVLGALHGPVDVGGDFNAFPWTGRVQKIAQASGTTLAGPMRRTYYVYGLPLPIDHVLAPDGGTTEVRPKLGSNHWGLVAEVIP